jgi:hypothetical protein
VRSRSTASAHSSCGGGRGRLFSTGRYPFSRLVSAVHHGVVTSSKPGGSGGTSLAGLHSFQRHFVTIRAGFPDLIGHAAAKVCAIRALLGGWG